MLGAHSTLVILGGHYLCHDLLLGVLDLILDVSFNLIRGMLQVVSDISRLQIVLLDCLERLDAIKKLI